MQSKYIYAGTYCSLLIERLLSNNQRDLLLATDSLADIRKVLQDTCFAPFLSPEKTLSEGLDDFLIAQKEHLLRIAPLPEALDILFLRYDYANLKLIKQAMSVEEPENEIIAKCWRLGTLEPIKLYRAFSPHHRDHLEPHLKNALAIDSKSSHRSLSEVLDKAYLEHSKELARRLKDPFISAYVETLIDLYNVEMRLRSFIHSESETIAVYGELVAGGQIETRHLETRESTLAILPRFGGKKLWQGAVSALTDNQDFSGIDLAIDNYTAEFLKKHTMEIHSPATLFAYFLSAVEHTQFIRSVITARDIGLSEVELRNIVRNSIHDYAY